MLRGAIFDIDGVVLDSLPMWKNLGLEFLKNKGISAQPSLSDTLFSMSMKDGARYLAENFPIKCTAAEAEDELRKMLEGFYFKSVLPKNVGLGLLALTKKHGLAAVAATESDETCVKCALERCGLKKNFMRIFSSSDGFRDKHFPDVFLASVKTLNCKPSETVVFEDSFYAAKTAVSAGFFTVGVFDAFGEKRICEMKEICDVFVEKYEDLEFLDERLKNMREGKE